MSTDILGCLIHDNYNMLQLQCRNIKQETAGVSRRSLQTFTVKQVVSGLRENYLESPQVQVCYFVAINIRISPCAGDDGLNASSLSCSQCHHWWCIVGYSGRQVSIILMDHTALLDKHDPTSVSATDSSSLFPGSPGSSSEVSSPPA